MTDDIRLLIAEAWRLSPRDVVVQLVTLLLTSLLGGASLLLLIPIVNSVADTSVTLSVPLLGNERLGSVPLWALLAAFVALMALQAFVSQVSAVTTARMQQLLVDRLRHDAIAAVLAARWTFLFDRRRSDIVAVISVGAVRAAMAYNQLLQFVVAGVFSIVTAVIALLVSPAVALIAIAGVIAMAAAQSLTVRPAHRLGTELGHRQRTMQGVVTDSLDSLRLIRAHSADAVWTERIVDAFAAAREVQVANTRRQSLVSSVTSVGTAVAASVLVLICVGLGISPATIVVILLLVFRLALSVRQMVSASALMANSLPAVRDLSELTQSAQLEVELPEGTATTRSGLGTDGVLLEFREVSYSYPGTDNGVRSLSFRVPRGAITAFSGPSGVGKSTAVDLVLGLLTPDAGQILVDREPLVPGDLRWWRDHLAYVPQETLLIPGSLRDNLTWSVHAARSDEDCWRALDQASASFARDLPQGLDTVLGDRGVRLSGGERQRVAIARALLRRPDLLVLDEATSSLDEPTEARILELMRSLTPAVTVLVIAHRRSTVDAADHLVEFDDARRN